MQKPKKMTKTQNTSINIITAMTTINIATNTNIVMIQMNTKNVTVMKNTKNAHAKKKKEKTASVKSMVMDIIITITTKMVKFWNKA